ncbi:MAG: nuclear transport factor 2 family protein [Actinomycetota bacterium]|nr:nuclear transport factor 2 family protein [Actinomycetota bacterium]
MADQVPAVGNVLTMIERRDWARLEHLLDPEVHWTTAVEEHLRGPTEVIARLRNDPPPAPPAYHEVRDGLITRWIDTPG